MQANLNDPELRVAGTARPYLDAMLEEAAQMTAVLKDERQTLLASCLHHLSRLEEWNRIAMGQRYVADDEIEIGIAVVRRSLNCVAEASTANFHPVQHLGLCPACDTPLSTIDVGQTRQMNCCEQCLEPVRNAIRDLGKHFCLGSHGITL